MSRVGMSRVGRDKLRKRTTSFGVDQLHVCLRRLASWRSRRSAARIPDPLPGEHRPEPRPAFPSALGSRTVLAVKGSLRRAKAARP